MNPNPKRPSPSPTPQPPEFAGTEFFLYSIHWDPDGVNETPDGPLNLFGDDDLIDWLDIYEYAKGWREQR